MSFKNRKKFNFDYYEDGINKNISGYENYRWLPELTNNSVKSIIKNLKIEDNESILDFGCAKGFIVKSFRSFNFDCYGCDISRYAIENCDESIKNFLTLQESKNQLLGKKNFYDWIISKDVLEHIPYEDINSTIAQLKKQTNKIFVVVPLGKNGKFIIPEYENDITHIIREDKDWWFNKFLKAGFKNITWSYSFPWVKENWYKINKKGNLFIYTTVQNIEK